MKYFVQVGDQRVEVSLEAGQASIDGESAPAHIAGVAGTPLHLLTIDGAVHRVNVRRSAGRGRYVLDVDGYRFDVEALDERAHAIRELSAASAGPAGPAPLVAPMPGLIVRVRVREGDTVVTGQGLVVMEAMKMENELRAAGAGTVRRVLAQPGTAVEKGTLLVELE